MLSLAKKSGPQTHQQDTEGSDNDDLVLLVATYSRSVHLRGDAHTGGQQNQHTQLARSGVLLYEALRFKVEYVPLEAAHHRAIAYEQNCRLEVAHSSEV